MTTIKTFVKDHPVLSYFVLTFAIGWGGILILVGGPRAVPGTQEVVGRLFLGVMMAWFAGPSLASILLTALIDGRAGLRSLLTRLIMWRVGARWYAVALLVAPLLTAACLLALSLTSSEFLPGIFTTDDKATLLMMGIGYALVGGGFLEELGWTGFAVCRLRQRYDALTAGLILGLLWGAYHFLVIFWSGSPSGSLPLAVLLPVHLFSWMPAYRVLMVWVYDHTGGSLLLGILMHASLTASQLILVPMAISREPLVIYMLVFTSALWIVNAAIAAARVRQSSQRPLQSRLA